MELRRVDQVIFTPIGHVRGGRIDATKDHWGQNRCSLVLDERRFTPAALAGLQDFSHVMVVFYFHIADEEPAELGARHPRGRTDWPEVGIFAQRGRMRPNRIGVSISALEQVKGLEVAVVGLDAVDGTPILDLKPVLSGYAPRGRVTEPDWGRELMANYW